MPRVRKELEIISKRIRAGLIQNGTDVAANERDPEGDGDQSTIQRTQHRQFYRVIFSEGGDFVQYFGTPEAVSTFAVLCVSGMVAAVRAMLEEADDPRQPRALARLVSLLETRETSMRLSPILMMASVAKNVSGDIVGDGQKIQVAELLLSYGARPEAKDVCGKTVCHYGAGAMATEMTKQVVQMCAEAYKTSYMFNQEVELFGLTDTTKNGLRGIARGCMAKSGRRVVQLLDGGADSKLAIKPENLRLVNDERTSSNTTNAVVEERNLCNLQCRLGTVSLLETVQARSTGGAETADFLINTLGASIDVADLDGMSARTLALAPMAERMSPAVTVIREAARKQGNVAWGARRHQCANCKKPESTDKPFMQCNACRLVRYCQKSCQVEHWHAGHKKECKLLQATKVEGVKLERPRSGSTPMYSATINFGTGQCSAPALESDGFQKPANVAAGERFYVKCQGGGPNQTLLIYDETRQCTFSYPPDHAGFEEIRAKIVAEPAFQGRKTYMKASFDPNGECTVYPHTSKLQKW